MTDNTTVTLCRSLFDDDNLGSCDYVAASVRVIEPAAYASLRDVKDSEKRKMRMLNKHLLSDRTPVDGKFQLPVVKAYAGEIPDVFVPYSARVCYNAQYKGVHCHINDAKFYTTWTRPYNGLVKVSHYMVATGPDYTVWADGRLCENLEQIRRNRTITRFWQDNGVDVIPSVAWGDATSIDSYAFDGLPDEGSWFSIGHQRVGNKQEQRLFQYAIRNLVERKHPIGIIVFGEPLDFDPGVRVLRRPSFISKLRKL